LTLQVLERACFVGCVLSTFRCMLSGRLFVMAARLVPWPCPLPPFPMLDPLLHEIFATVHVVDVEVGTRVLTRSDGSLDPSRVVAIAEQLAEIIAAGKRVVLVSSGAVGAGIGRLKLMRRPTDLAELQAIAAVGQSCLIEAYNRALETHGRHAA